ncbi:MAG: DUF6515 family protein [Candidatus Omnitrophica bacterium]|nr:DUF6515 family protein [Candidatus Omnitrophota bacterium]
MNKNIYSNKFWVIAGFCLMFMLSSSNAFAWDRGRSRGGSREVVTVRGERYHYHDGRFYRPGWFGLELAIGVPPIGAVVTFLPSRHRTIISGGVAYYYYSDIYYTACPSGYIVVPAPAVVALPTVPVVQPKVTAEEAAIINIPNSNGSYTTVTLVKHNNGYIGPQGEYYPAHPTVEQLKVLYGK